MRTIGSLSMIISALAVSSCAGGYIYLVDPPAEGGADGSTAHRDAAAHGGGGGNDAQSQTHPDAGGGGNPDAAPGPLDSGGTVDRDAGSGTTTDSGGSHPPPPPPQGSPYDNASEQMNDLTRALDITGNFGVALAGGHLLAGDASGGTSLPRNTPVSSSGTLQIPAGATIHTALLFYAGAIFQKPGPHGDGDYTTDLGGPLDGLSDVQGNGITFSINNTNYGPFDPSGRAPMNPSSLGSEAQISPQFYAPSFGTLTGVKESMWGNRLDLTGVMRGMSGTLNIRVNAPERLDPNANDSGHNAGNPAGNTTYNLCSGGASWSMLVIYEKSDLPRSNLVLLDGPFARAWDYLFFHTGVWHRPKVRIDHAPIQHGARFFVYAPSSSPAGLPLPGSPTCSCGCGGQYTLSNSPGPYGRNNYFSDTYEDPAAARSDPMHRDRTNGPWYLSSGGLGTGIAGNDWTLFQSGLVYTEFPNLYEGENAPGPDSTQPVTNENDPDASHDTYAGHPWNGRGTVTYHGHGNANSTVEVAVDDARITVGETTSYLYFKGDQKDVWKPQQVVSVKYILFSTPVP